jgi:cytochrome c-type biogenesis protein CcsB
MKFEDHEAVDLYLSWSINPYYWADKPVIAALYPGLKDLLGIAPDVKRVSYASLISAEGQYVLAEQVGVAHRTPDRDRTKTQRKLISFDERFQMLNMAFQGWGLKLYPIPGDPNDTWGTLQEVVRSIDPAVAQEYQAASTALDQGVQSGNNAQIVDALRKLHTIQTTLGSNVLPAKNVIDAELFYNKTDPWFYLIFPLMGAFIILLPVYLFNLFKNKGAPLSFKNPFYALGMAVYVAAFAGMIWAYTLRWIASERIPISNGHESLLFISLAVAAAGLIFDFIYRSGALAALGGLLTTIVVGVSMLSTFDPAIGPLVPVLVSYWLNIHVTIITASYGFLGLAALIGMLILFLLMVKGPGRDHVRHAVKHLDDVNKYVIITGLGLLTVGTLLGGVWANESWGRYWGWDPKETWSLITILVYSVVLHFRWIPQMRSTWLNASASMAAIASVVMTYFGVNYFLSGLHSYGGGDAIPVPSWVYLFTAGFIALIAVSGLVSRSRSWK